MHAPDTQAVLTLWTDSTGAPPHQRLAALLSASSDAPGDMDSDTLGQRNRRLMQLHRALVDAPIEAQVACAACASVNMFVVPVAQMLALPATGQAEVPVRLPGAARVVRFRLPTMADISAAADGANDCDTDADVQRAVLARCLLEPTAISLDESSIAAAEAAFDAADPLASVMVEAACSGCGAGVSASVDIAQFVAADIDRFVARVLRDIDVIASAYGWSEPQILALPAQRRADYVAMIVARRAGTTAPQLIRGGRAA